MASLMPGHIQRAFALCMRHFRPPRPLFQPRRGLQAATSVPVAPKTFPARNNKSGNNTKSVAGIFTDLYILTHSMPRTLAAVFPALNFCFFVFLFCF